MPHQLLTHLAVDLQIDAVSVKPSPTALPGISAAEKLVNGLAYFIILACVGGALFGIGQWVLGSRTSNYSQAGGGTQQGGGGEAAARSAG